MSAEPRPFGWEDIDNWPLGLTLRPSFSMPLWSLESFGPSSPSFDNLCLSISGVKTVLGNAKPIFYLVEADSICRVLFSQFAKTLGLCNELRELW